MIIRVKYEDKIYKGFRFIGKEGHNLLQIYGHHENALYNYNPELGCAYNVMECDVIILQNNNKGGKLL